MTSAIWASGYTGGASDGCRRDGYSGGVGGGGWRRQWRGDDAAVVMAMIRRWCLMV